MVKIIASAEFANIADTGRVSDFAITQTVEHQDLLDGFGEFLDYGSLSPFSLSASKFVFTGGVDVWDFRITVQGSGISPVSSLADLEAAFEAGLATGALSSITVEGSKSASFPGDSVIATTEFLTVAMTPAGYSLTSGSQVVEVKGSLPTDLGQFHTLVGIADDLSVFDTLNNARKTKIINDLNDFGIEELSLSSGGTTMMELSVSATEISLGLLGYTASLIGDFPTGAGDAIPFLFELMDTADFGAPLDFSDIAGFSVSQIRATNPDGKVVLRTNGDLGTSDTISLDTLIIDGVKVTNPIFGDNTENYVSRYLDPFPFWEPGDMLYGTNGKDHIFGLGGNDLLDGGNGNDFLFGGSGNDQLFGGNGNDLLNPGSNLSGDTVSGSRGKDTVVFSDSGDGYQSLSYYGFERAIAATIDGVANTGTVTKSGLGKDTLVDVSVPMQAGNTSATGGFGIEGSRFDDRFEIVTATNSWSEVIGHDGTDAFDLTVSNGSILRLTHYGDQGAKVNLKTGVVANDSWGNREMLDITIKGGQIELRGTQFNDRLIGSGAGERFILDGGNDFADGGGGTDLIRYDRFGVDAVNVNLSKQMATGTWNGSAFTDKLKNFEDIRGSRDSDDLLIGNNKGNSIEGEGGDDRISGRGGHDDLRGEAGNDILRGDNGRDTLTGGTGHDSLTGGGQRDVFVFDAMLNEGRDTITDFQDGTDRIKVAGAQFADLTIGDDGTDAVVGLSGGTEIRLSGVSSSELGSGDFIFV